jgi:pimeloyl-ACP methyl ester carboxylesterase
MGPGSHPIRAKLARSQPSRSRVMEMVEVDGLHIAYEQAGSGPVLVLLHGYVGDGPTTWRRQLDARPRGVALAQPGSGQGRSPELHCRSRVRTRVLAGL